MPLLPAVFAGPTSRVLIPTPLATPSPQLQPVSTNPPLSTSSAIAPRTPITASDSIEATQPVSSGPSAATFSGIGTSVVVVAVVLIVLGLVLIVASTIFALYVRRAHARGSSVGPTGPWLFVGSSTGTGSSSRDGGDARSLATSSWHDGGPGGPSTLWRFSQTTPYSTSKLSLPDCPVSATNSWHVESVYHASSSSPVWRPLHFRHAGAGAGAYPADKGKSRRSSPSPPPDYIPYTGPIAPPALPFPANPDWRQRPLPDLPDEENDELNRLGLTLYARSPRARRERERDHDHMPRTHAGVAVNISSVLSEMSMSQSSNPHSPVITAMAFNARRSVPHMYQAMDDLDSPLSASFSTHPHPHSHTHTHNTPPLPVLPPLAHLGRSRSWRRLTTSRKSSHAASQPHRGVPRQPTDKDKGKDKHQTRSSASTTVSLLSRSSTTKSSKSVRFANSSGGGGGGGDKDDLAAAYPFAGFGPCPGLGLGPLPLPGASGAVVPALPALPSPARPNLGSTRPRV